jgi:hypothetical protein
LYLSTKKLNNKSQSISVRSLGDKVFGVLRCDRHIIDPKRDSGVIWTDPRLLALRLVN